jgi:peptidoglycan/xylan/chitin deacetylase (PgdA/CDA1 family)
MVPIVAYHSIADDHDHLLEHLSLSVDVFERQLRHLHRTGFVTTTLHDVVRFLKGEKELPRKSIVLTFDDGYLDNWVFAFPLLKKYGMKATIFIATDFVDPTPACRPNLDDVWAGRVPRKDLDWWGHLSWAELREMTASGLVDVQSHTRTHAWHFVSDRIIDFHHPGDDYYWLYWNRFPEKKHAWLSEDFRKPVPWGTPVYEFDQTLLRRRYFEDPSLTEALTRYVADRGGEAFFSRSAWREELEGVAAARRAAHGDAGRLESEEEYQERLSDELAGSKAILEEGLQKPVDFLCWPCGDYSPALQQLALANGYHATVNVAKVTNAPGDDPGELRRIVFGQDYRGPLKSSLIYWHFVGNVNTRSGNVLAFPIAPAARRLMMLGRLFQRLTARRNGARYGTR